MCLEGSPPDHTPSETVSSQEILQYQSIVLVVKDALPTLSQSLKCLEGVVESTLTLNTVICLCLCRLHKALLLSCTSLYFLDNSPVQLFFILNSRLWTRPVVLAHLDMMRIWLLSLGQMREQFHKPHTLVLTREDELKKMFRFCLRASRAESQKDLECLLVAEQANASDRSANDRMGDQDEEELANLLTELDEDEPLSLRNLDFLTDGRKVQFADLRERCSEVFEQ